MLRTQRLQPVTMKPFRLLTLAVCAAATVPRLAQRGMFVDGEARKGVGLQRGGRGHLINGLIDLFL